MDCKAKLEKYFRDNRVEFQAMTHRTAYTAQEVAAAQGVKGKQVAKVTMVIADARVVMLVLPASHRIDFPKLKKALGAKEARLAKEEEFSNLFPDCDTGAMPPFGNIYRVEAYVDRSLTEDPEIVVQAGSHRDTIKIAYKDYARLAQPNVAEFAVHL
jgi:Ala-tRNA(Pro) deacylase